MKIYRDNTVLALILVCAYRPRYSNRNLIKLRGIYIQFTFPEIPFQPIELKAWTKFQQDEINVEELASELTAALDQSNSFPLS